MVREHGEQATAVIELAASISEGQGGKKPGRATRSSLEAATKPQDAPEPLPDAEQPRIGCKAVLEILRSATAIQEAGEVAVYVSVSDWDRISALF